MKLNDNMIGLCAISLNVPGKLKFNTSDESLPFGKNNPLNEGELQTITITVKIMKGLQAYNTCFAVRCFVGSGLTSFEL